MFIAAGFGTISIGMSITWSNVLDSDMMVNNSTIFGTQIKFSDVQKDMVGKSGVNKVSYTKSMFL